MKNKVKELRELRRMTEKQLADKINVSVETVKSIEHGFYEPSISVAMRIAKTLGSLVDYVFPEPEKELQSWV